MTRQALTAKAALTNESAERVAIIEDMTTITQLAQQMVDARSQGAPFYAFTGAGISTESGLPDFRSETGMWTEKEAMEASSASGFRQAPHRVWELFVDPMVGIELTPNEGHTALAELVDLGLISRVVTQNVDDLHELAGVEETHVDHLHGDLKSAVCHDCLRGWDMSEKAAQRQQMLSEGASGADAVPGCAECGQPLQPSVTLFEQDLPPRAWKNAQRVSEQAAGVLVCGSSLSVTPANGLPYTTGRRGGVVAIVNRGATEMDSALDPDHDYRFDGACGEILPKLASECKRLMEASDPAQ